jgi:cytoskeleton protein RodZ
MATGIGDVLRAARREQGRTLGDAAAEIRVRETYLAALEEEDFAAMGGDVYVKGFLRSYARYLGVDPNPLLERFRAEHERSEDRAPIAPHPFPPVGPMGPRHGPPRAVIIGGILVSMLIVLGFIGLASDHQPAVPALPPAPLRTTAPRGPSPSAEPSASTPSLEGAKPDPFETAIPAESASPAMSEPFTELLVKLTVVGGESYVRSDGASPKIEGVFQRGYTNTLRGTRMIRLRIGDAASVALTVNGRDLGALGSHGQVVQVICQVGETACQIRAGKTQ